MKCNAGYDLDATLDAADGATDGSATIQCVRATVFNPVLPDPTCIPQVGRLVRDIGFMLGYNCLNLLLIK